jgi:hypothetical protein
MLFFHEEVPNDAVLVHALQVRQIASFCSRATAFENLYYKILMSATHGPGVFAFAFIQEADNGQQVHPKADKNDQHPPPKGKIISEQQ